MNGEDMLKVLEQFKAEGHSDEEILGAAYKMFQDDKISLEDLENITNLLGYHLTDEFKNMSPEDQKVKGVEKVDDAEGASKAQIEEAKEDEQGEKPAPAEAGGVKAHEDEEKPEPEKGEDEGDKEDDKSADKEEESDEEAKAMKLFGSK